MNMKIAYILAFPAKGKYPLVKFALLQPYSIFPFDIEPDSKVTIAPLLFPDPDKELQ